MSEKENNKAKFGEKLSLKFRKKWIVNDSIAFFIIIILFAAYIVINLQSQQMDLPKIDVTENKIYTLSDASKEVISKINQEIKIYVYGFEEKSPLVDFLKQYNKINNKISYEILTNDSNKDLISKYELQEGYSVIILKSGDAEKAISSSELVTYDYTTYEQIDITEQTLTNSMLALTEEHKPTVYFVEGHNEYNLTTELTILNSFLKNEAFNVNTINITTTGSIPDDCNILAIMSPKTDFLEPEVNAIKDYINKGGNIYLSKDITSSDTTLPNLQSILDEYGVSIENGYIIENSSDSTIAEAPYIFRPIPSTYHKITQDISSDSYMVLMDVGRLKFKTDEELSNLKVAKDVLLTSSDVSSFATDMSADFETNRANAQVGSSDIAALLTKTISLSSTTEEGENIEGVSSKLIVVATGNFITDYTSPLSNTYPISTIGSNKDFVINSMSYLGEKENILTIRKDMSSSTYQPTDQENAMVLAVIISVPVMIILIGVVVSKIRKRK